MSYELRLVSEELDHKGAPDRDFPPLQVFLEFKKTDQ